MTKAYDKTYYLTKLAALSPTVDNIRLVLAALRRAFNRSDLSELAVLPKILDTITLDLDEFFEDVEIAQTKPGQQENPYLVKLTGILGHLEHIANEFKLLAEPIERKIKGSIIIPDKDFFHINDLFIHVKGLLRGLADLFHAVNPPLRRYLLGQAEHIREHCFQAATAHETTMTHSFGHPQSFAVYFEIMDRFKKVLHHMTELIKIMIRKD
jgi:Na+/phosphate symporter